MEQTAILTTEVFDNVWDRRAVEWNLTPDSLVVEVGGYKGRWAAQIAQRYNPRLLVYEPQPWAYEICQSKLIGFNAEVFNFALGNKDADSLPMGEWETDGCSLVTDTRRQGVGQMRDAAAVLGSLDIDLMLVNIEGYEYQLIPYLFDSGILPKILMVQLHQFADPTGAGGRRILEGLTQNGYAVKWTYGTVLSAWERIQEL